VTTLSTKDSFAIFGERCAWGLVEHSKDPKCLEQKGFWAVVQTFEGEFSAYRFESISENISGTISVAVDFDIETYSGIPIEQWTSTMNQHAYEGGVTQIRADIERGWVYQTNLCRVLSVALKQSVNALGLWSLLRTHNPAPYLSVVSVNAQLGIESDVRIVSASPELFLSRSGQQILTSPIKGTAAVGTELLEKDSAENVMIVDLMRNDLSSVCVDGSVRVVDLLRIEQHPTLVHLVSDVAGVLKPDTSWSDMLAALMPPGSVSGAPKSSSLEVIGRIEPSPRGVYCGFVGWIDTRNDTAELAVAIRTFWQESTPAGPELRFGTGAGITWGSDPSLEWKETELKARNLLSVAAKTLP